MTPKRRENPLTAKPSAGQKENLKPGRPVHTHARTRGGRSQGHQHAPQTEPSVSKYEELLQDVQDEVSFFLPVEALAAGTHRYLYHLGDFSEENCTKMAQFLEEKHSSLSSLQQGRLSASERRSASALRLYMENLTALLKNNYFSDTLWQLHNARIAFYQLLYVSEIPTYVRGKALLHRLEEFATFPTAPGENISFRSSSHERLALQELRLIEQYLSYVEENVSKFDDKQAIAERVVQARQYAIRVRSRVAHADVAGMPSSGNLPSIIFAHDLNESHLQEITEDLTHEIEFFNHRLAESALRINPTGDMDETIRTTLQESHNQPLDQTFIDNWIAKDYPRLRSLFPGYKLKTLPVECKTPEGTTASYDALQILFLWGVSLHHREPICLLFPSLRWLSPEIQLMMDYFPGRAYIKTATSSCDPDLTFDLQRDIFTGALAQFELQNIAAVDDILPPRTMILVALQLLVEDTMALLDTELLQNHVSFSGIGSFLQEHLEWLPQDLVGIFSDIALLDQGIPLARSLFRSRLQELRKMSKTNGKKASWTSFYQSIFEQGTFDLSQLRNP